MANGSDISDYNWVQQSFPQGTMTPMVSTITIQAGPQWSAQVTDGLRPLNNMAQAISPALEAIADYIRQQMIPKVFDNEGPGWRNLAKRTQSERIAAGYNPNHPILKRTGDLFNELTNKAHPKHIESITITEDRAMVTVGGSSEKFINNQLGRGDLNLPARPMLPGTGGLALSGADEDAITTIFKQKLTEALGTQS